MKSIEYHLDAFARHAIAIRNFENIVGVDMPPVDVATFLAMADEAQRRYGARFDTEVTIGKFGVCFTARLTDREVPVRIHVKVGS